MLEIWANLLLPKALKSCPKSKKSPDLVTLTEVHKGLLSLSLLLGDKSDCISLTFTFNPLGERSFSVFFLSYQSSVTRFGEISRLWQTFIGLGLFFDGLIFMCQTFKPTYFGNFL